MASELERLVDELRAIAADVERLRPRLAQHAGVVRRFAAEVAAVPEERTSAISLLNLAGRQCDELSAELAQAKRAADHFAGRVLSGPGSGSASGGT
jgi:hypothetical protein